EATPQIYLSGEYVYGDYSDGNEKRTIVLETGYIFSKAPYLRAAYTYFYLDFDDPARSFKEGKRTESAYYDPVNLESHTIRLEFRDDAEKGFSWGVEGYVTHTPKSNGIAGALFAFGAYNFGDQGAIRLDARGFYQDDGIDRAGKTDHFWARDFVLAYEYRF
ncbi:MAG: hypothetical protein JRK53_20065, partial [Deltaproteobacteria bacterium]|nr:hypothetical protein [Deltaproteobacteria bacterium]